VAEVEAEVVVEDEGGWKQAAIIICGVIYQQKESMKYQDGGQRENDLKKN
jgi:hypothetical protein